MENMQMIYKRRAWERREIVAFVSGFSVMCTLTLALFLFDAFVFLPLAFVFSLAVAAASFKAKKGAVAGGRQEMLLPNFILNLSILAVLFFLFK